MTYMVPVRRSHSNRSHKKSQLDSHSINCKRIFSCILRPLYSSQYSRLKMVVKLRELFTRRTISEIPINDGLPVGSSLATRTISRPSFHDALEFHTSHHSYAAIEFAQALLNRDKGPPPARLEAIQRLPLERVFPWHRTDERYVADCNVCCERLVQGSAVTRMPCGHTFHASCLHTWLQRHCTCPECRYELETDDDSFESGREERMKNRTLPITSANCGCPRTGPHTCIVDATLDFPYCVVALSA